MAGIDWIKISTGILQDEKIQLIEGMPEGDTLFSMWIKLLVIAGKSNMDGYLYITEDLPYGIDDFSTVFHKPERLVRAAFNVFIKLKMVSEDNINGRIVYYITNWGKHQNLDGMDKVREQNKKRIREYRKRINERKQLLLGMPESNINKSNVTVTLRNATDIDIKNKNKIIEQCNVTLPLKDDDDNIFKFYESNFGRLSDYISIELKSMLEDYTSKRIIEAMKESISHNGKSLSYLKTVLNNGNGHNGHKGNGNGNRQPDPLWG